MARVVADTHALLWMLKGTLRERSPLGADAIEQALDAKALCVSIGSFLDLRYLVDSGRLSEQLLFDRIIAATALTLDPQLVSADEDIQGAIGERVIW